MRGRSWHRARVLLLAVLLGAGMSLSFSQASAMAAKMALAPEMAHAGSAACPGCDGDDRGGADTFSCLLLCAFAAHGLLPGEPADLASASGARFQIAHRLVTGHASAPDHGPPKPVILG
jgi:hypothetical protein